MKALARSTSGAARRCCPTSLPADGGDRRHATAIATGQRRTSDCLCMCLGRRDWSRVPKIRETRSELADTQDHWGTEVGISEREMRGVAVGAGPALPRYWLSVGVLLSTGGFLQLGSRLGVGADARSTRSLALALQAWAVHPGQTRRGSGAAWGLHSDEYGLILGDLLQDVAGEETARNRATEKRSMAALSSSEATASATRLALGPRRSAS